MLHLGPRRTAVAFSLPAAPEGRLLPDLSQAGEAQYARGGAARDSVIRQFYVGATRAYESLYICRAESSQAIGI